MNPLKALLDSFDHLINERGSAAILRERLALAADQYSTLEKENAALKEENAKLRTDNEELRGKIQQYEKLKSEVFNKSLPFQETPI